jgi:hypothetical protein
MVSAEWGTRNGLTSKFARPEPHGELMGYIYADVKQYTNITELKATIISCWENIEVFMLQKLVGSMCDCAFKVDLKQDSFTDY